MIAKKLKAKIDNDLKIVLHLSDITPGDVEVIILKDEEQDNNSVKELLSNIPRHKTGKIKGTLNREEMYPDVR